MKRPDLFLRGLHWITLPPAVLGGSDCSIFSPAFQIVSHLFLALLVGIHCSLILILIYTYLIINDVEPFFMVTLSFGHMFTDSLNHCHPQLCGETWQSGQELHSENLS